MVTRTARSDYALIRPDQVKIGSWFGSGQTNGDGLLNGRLSETVVLTGSSSNSLDSTGNYRAYDTGATINSLIGLRASALVMNRINNCYFKAGIYLSSVANVRVYAGLVASTAAPASSADPLNALSGIGLWLDSGVSADWKLYHNDASGAGVVDALSPTVTAAATTLYPIEIQAVTDNKFTFIFNGVETNVSTDIPGSTTSLGFRVNIENTTGASKIVRCYYIIIRNDK